MHAVLSCEESVSRWMSFIRDRKHMPPENIRIFLSMLYKGQHRFSVACSGL